MRLTGMLAWWDEPEEMLDACVRSCAGLLDRIVCLDGGYRLMPEATPRSPKGQAEAIKAAARDAGIEARVLVPKRVWAGQIEKRQFLLAMTAAEEPDLLMPIDADWLLAGDKRIARHELVANMSVDRFQVQFFTPRPEGIDLAEAAANAWHAETAGGVQWLDLIYRVLPDMRIERHHWWYSGVKDGERVALWGCDGLYPPASQHRLSPLFRIEHHCLTRPADTILRNRAYCARRDLQVAQTGAES